MAKYWCGTNFLHVYVQNGQRLVSSWCPFEKNVTKTLFYPGRGGGQVVSVLAFYSDDPSSNPAEVYNFSVKLLLKRTKINKKRPGLTHFFKKITANLIFKFLKFTLSNKIKALFYFFLPRICGYIMIHSSFLLLSRWSWLMG